MRTGVTKKPCPGCGKEGLRPKDRVCTDCADILASPKRERALDEWINALEERRFERGWFNFVPYISDPGSDPRKPGHAEEVREAIGKFLLGLFPPSHLKGACAIQAVIDGTRDESWHIPGVPDYDRNEVGLASLRLVPPGFLGLMKDALQKVQDMNYAAYNAGKAEGAGLLQRLAAGELTVTEFDKAVAPRSTPPVRYS